MEHEDPTLDVEAALRDEEELAVLAELGAAWTAPDEEPSATPPGDAAASPGEPGSDSEKAPTGPPQKGRDKKRHYVYGVTHARLRERGLSLGLQPPEAFTREGFSDLLREAYTACSMDLQETATFKEPHEDGAPHNYALVRAAKQHRWAPVADWLFKERQVRVDFGSNVRTWHDGVVYACVPSAHKTAAALDSTPYQWTKEGTPVPLTQHIPARMQGPNFVRTGKLSPTAALDVRPCL